MLRNYPIYFNTDVISIPHAAWIVNPDTISTSNLTEAGTEDVEVTRFGKLTISASYQCTDRWARFFAGYNNIKSFTLKFYDVLTDDYVEKTVRMSGLSIDEVQYSDRLPSTNGLYIVSFSLLEF